MNLQTIFTIFFITLGPIKVILPFMNATANADPTLRRMIALRAFLISTGIVIILAVFGTQFTSKFDISRNGMSITGGVILFVWSLNSLLQQTRPAKPPDPPEHPNLGLAASPLSVPVIITPAGVTAILYFAMISTRGDLVVMETLIGLLLSVMVLNLIFMLGAKPILRAIGGPITLQVVGGVLAVLQASLAVEVIIRSIQRMA